MLRIQSLIKVAWRQWKYIMHCRNRSEFYAHQFTFLFLVGWILWLVIIFFFFKKRLMSALPCSFWQGCIIFYLCTSHLKNIFVVIVVQSLSHVWLFATPCTTALQASLSFTISQNLLKFMSIESVMQSSHFIFCYLLLLWKASGSFRISRLKYNWINFLYWWSEISPKVARTWFTITAVMVIKKSQCKKHLEQAKRWAVKLWITKKFHVQDQE